jgi:poly-beta-1,6-N-acetyl-D-glucosamine synthase
MKQVHDPVNEHLGRAVPHTGRLLTVLAVSGCGIFAYCLLAVRVHGPTEFSVTGPLLSLSILALASSLWVARVTIDGMTQANSLEPVARQVRALRVRVVISLLMTPVLAAFLNVGSMNALLGIVLANAILLEAIPIAVLLVSRRFGIVLAILVAQGASALLFLELAPSNAGIATTLSIPLLASLVGTIVMAFIAIWLNSLSPTSSPDSDLWHPRPLHLRPPGASVCVPIILTMFQARHVLNAEIAGVFSCAAFIGACVVLIGGLGIAALVLPPVGAEKSLGKTRGFEASLLVAAALTGIVGNPLIGLFEVLVPLCLVGLGWSLMTFASWVRVADGGSGYPFVVASATAVVVELLLGMWADSFSLVALLPVAGFLIYALAFKVTPIPQHREETAVPLLANSEAPVSVGILAYNEESTITSSLHAFLNQYTNASRIAEIIVISSGSTDGTDDAIRRVAAADDRVRLITEEEKLGKVFSVARFLKEASSPICIVASADVTPAQDCVEQLVIPMLRAPQVAMTGPSVVPRYRKGFVPLMHRYLWMLHNQINALGHSTKLGEIVAVRRDLVKLEPIAGCDEVLLEASVIEAGGRLQYAPGAVVYNLSPTNLMEYVEHRRRIHAQHLMTESILDYKAATTNTSKMVVTLTTEVLRQPYLFAPAVACALAEVWGRSLGRRDTLRGEIKLTWHPTHSARATKQDAQKSPS